MKTENAFEQLCDSIWEDDELAFEAKAQDVAIALASAVEDAGLSRVQLAEILDWKPSRVTKVLTGSANLTLKTIFQVCSALGLEFDVVLRKANERSVYHETISNLHKSRELLAAATILHRRLSLSALSTRSYKREEVRLKLVA